MNLAHVLMEDFDHCIVKHAEKSLESFSKNTLMKFYLAVELRAQRHNIQSLCQPLPTIQEKQIIMNSLNRKQW